MDPWSKVSHESCRSIIRYFRTLEEESVVGVCFETVVVQLFVRNNVFKEVQHEGVRS